MDNPELQRRKSRSKGQSNYRNMGCSKVIEEGYSSDDRTLVGRIDQERHKERKGRRSILHPYEYKGERKMQTTVLLKGYWLDTVWRKGK